MKFNFRQGLHHSPMTSGAPSFLTYNSGNNTITTAVGIDHVRATAAWKSVNYLIEARENQADAWGPFNNGTGTYYLFWDINLASGALTRGFTMLQPAFGLTPPLSLSSDQHWFDTTTNVMKVWDGVQWNQKIRVFAATYAGGTHVITEYPLGTQVGIVANSSLQSTWFDHGYILYGIDQKAIKNSDGSMVTTAVHLSTYHGSFSSPIRLELSNSLALADEPIPAFSAVTAVGDGTIKLASGSNPEKRPIGISPVPVMTGDPVDIVFKGIVYNDQWDWNYTLGKDLYCGSTGTLFQGDGSVTSATRVGAILDANTVLIDIDLFGQGTGGGGGITWPLLAPPEYNHPNVVIPFSFEDSQATGLQVKTSISTSFDPYKWILTYGELSPGEFGFDDVYAESLAYDSLGNVYAIGGDGNGNSNLGFIVKHDNKGNFVWDRRFDNFNSNGDPEPQSLESIKIDSNDNIYIGVSQSINGYYGTATVPTVVKMNTNGDLIWQSQLAEVLQTDQDLRGIAIDGQGDIVVCGIFYNGSIDQTYVKKADKTTGELLWTVIFDGLSNFGYNAESTQNTPQAVTADSDGNIYVSGRANVIWTNSNTTTTRYLVKLDADGVLLWHKIGKCIEATDSGNSYAVGKDVAVNSTGIYQLTQVDNFDDYTSGILTKYNSSGTIVWETELDSVEFSSIAIDSTGNSYISSSGEESNGDSIAIAKYNSSGVLQWSRLLSNSGASTYQWYSYGLGSIAVHNDRIAIAGYTSFKLTNTEAVNRALVVQMGTDGSRIDNYGPMIGVNNKQINPANFTYVAGNFDVVSSEINDGGSLISFNVDADENTNYFTGTLTFNRIIDYNSVKVPNQPAVIGDELLFSRESNVSLKLTTIEGEEVVQIDTAQLGLRLTPTEASAETRNVEHNNEQLQGLIRTTKGTLQTKLELNVGNNPYAIEVGGATGYQAISPYQTVVYRPDFLQSQMVLDYGQSSSILVYLDPFNPTDVSGLINGISGEQYELAYRFANPNLGVSAFYKYPQTDPSNGFFGPVLVVANMGLRNITCIGMKDIGYFSQTYITQTALVTGRPKQIVLSNNGIVSDYFGTSSLDTAFVSTNGNRIEMLGQNAEGSRILGNKNSRENAKELPLTTSLNSQNNMDGYMWMNPVTNHLFAVGLSGDIWEVDSTTINPVEVNHITLPSTVKVISVNGDSLLNELFVLYTNNGVLTLCKIDCSTLTTFNTTIINGFVDTAHEIIVDETNSQVFVSTSNGINLHFVAFDTSVSPAVIINNQQIPLLVGLAAPSLNLKLEKAEGTSSGTKVFIPHADQVIVIDSNTWVPAIITHMTPSEPGPIINRLIYDPIQGYVFGTNANHSPSARNTLYDGSIRINSTDLLIDEIKFSYTYATLGKPWKQTDTVNSFGDLPSSGIAPGEVYKTLDTGFSYMATESSSWMDLDGSIFYSRTIDDNLEVNKIQTFSVESFTEQNATFEIVPVIAGEFSDFDNTNDVILFPDAGVPVNTVWETSIPAPSVFNQTWIMKLSKIAFYDDMNYDRNNKWYCTAIAGPYSIFPYLVPQG